MGNSNFGVSELISNINLYHKIHFKMMVKCTTAHSVFIYI